MSESGDHPPPPLARRASVSRRGSVSSVHSADDFPGMSHQPKKTPSSMGRRSSVALVNMELKKATEHAAQVGDEDARNFASYLKNDLNRVVESENSGKADLGAVVKQDRLSDFDSRVAFRNRIHLGLAVFSIMTFMMEIWVAYDREVCWAGWDNHDEIRQAASWEICLQQNMKTYVCKLTMSVTTFVLIAMITDYYRMQLAAEKQAHWFVHDSISWRRYVFVMWLCEVIVILPHPYPTGLPTTVGENPRWYDDKFGSFMFLRSYLILRVLRDSSPMYKKRMLMLSDKFLKKIGAVDFNWHFISKFLFLNNTWTIVWLGLVYVWFVMAYVIWIYEREHNYFFDLPTAVWMTCITMSTVGYGDVSATNDSAKVASGIAAVMGIILAALMVFAVTSSLTSTSQDTRAQNLLMRTTTIEEARTYAANYIQLWWRRYKAKAIAASDGSGKNLDPSISPAPVNDGQFFALNSFWKAKLREARRDFAMSMDLEELVTDRLEAKMADITDVVAEALATRLGLRPVWEVEMFDGKPASLVDLADKVGGMYEDARRIRSKTEAAHKVVIDGAGIFG